MAAFKLASNGSEVVSRLFPGARITSGYRGPDHPLSRKNPKSYHARSHAAVDMAAVPGMTFEQAKAHITRQGYRLAEAIDEYANPSKHATGGHWHFVIEER